MEDSDRANLEDSVHKFSFANPAGRSDTPTVADIPSQEPSLTTIDPAAGLETSNAYTSAAIAGTDGNDACDIADRTEQEPSLLQVVENGQEPSLMQSSNFAESSLSPHGYLDGGVPSNDSTNGDDASAPATLEAEAAKASASEAAPAVASSDMQELSSSSGTAAGAAPVDAGAAADGVQQQQQQQAAAAVQQKDAAAGVSQMGPLLPAGTNPIGQEAATAAVAVSSTNLAAASGRAQDKSYFVDGIRAIDVEVDCGAGIPCRLLHVTMDVSALQQAPKPFLGGYKHKHNGVVYHHASSQTPKQPKQGSGQGAAAAAAGAEGASAKEKLSRETQTIKAASSSCQTVREAATQMARPGLALNCSGDRLLTPRAYTTSEVVGQRRSSAALTIQRYCRGWLARCRAAALRGIKLERDGFLADAAAERAAAAQADRRHEVERRTHPLSHADFALLSSELETWRQQQTAAIKAAAQQPQQPEGFDPQAALQLLLAKETRLLQTLDKLRVNAKGEVKARHTERLLDNLSQPKTWTLSNGKKVMVHTPSTVRAAELQQLYRGLSLSGLTLDERLDVLLHVKWAAKEYDCGLTRELVELIDRQADLLNRGRSPKTLDGLRRRIAGAFLAFCQNPAFNPEASRLQLVPGGPSEPETFEYVEECVDEGA